MCWAPGRGRSGIWTLGSRFQVLAPAGTQSSSASPREATCPRTPVLPSLGSQSSGLQPKVQIPPVSFGQWGASLHGETPGPRLGQSSPRAGGPVCSGLCTGPLPWV